MNLGYGRSKISFYNSLICLLKTYLARDDDHVPPAAAFESLNVDDIENGEVSGGGVAGFRELHGNKLDSCFNGDSDGPLLNEVVHELLDESLLDGGESSVAQSGIQGDDEGAVHTLSSENNGEGSLSLVGECNIPDTAELTESRESELEEVEGP